MTILVTPKSDAEVNQLVSVLNSAGYKHLALPDEAQAFSVGVPAVLFEAFKEYCHKACTTLVEAYDIPVLTVNELGTYLQGS